MGNTLEEMRERLRDALSDEQDETWSAGEKDETLLFVVRRLGQRNPWPLDPEAQSIALVADQFYYDLPGNVVSVSQVSWSNADGEPLGYLAGGSWEVVGDPWTSQGKLHVAPRIANAGGTLYILGYGRYTIPDKGTVFADENPTLPNDYVQLVLDLATARLLRQLLSSRARFQQWQNANQTQNITVNELIQMINLAEAAAKSELAELKRAQRPVPARV